IDDAALGGRGGGGSLVAQNWLNLAAERGLSNFDQRHLLNVSWQYSTGVGKWGGTLLDGWRGALVKDWTLTSSIIAGSGFPLNHVTDQGWNTTVGNAQFGLPTAANQMRTLQANLRVRF